MAYLIVDAKVLEDKGVKYFNRTKDGRGVIYDSDAKVLGDLGEVERVETAAEVLEMLDN